MFRKFKDFHLLSVCIEFYSFHQPPPEERLKHSSALIPKADQIHGQWKCKCTRYVITNLMGYDALHTHV